MMAVAPEQQRRGHGAALLQQILARETATAPTLPIVLTTHLPRNVVFYQRASFDVIDERELEPPGAPKYTVWTMRRAPQQR
jgi:GNAT superfamily N-acetyltransferase